MIRMLVFLMFALAPVSIHSQGKNIAAPAESAPANEQRKWLLKTVGKYASYKTRTISVSITAPKLESCVLSFVQTKKVGSTSQDTMGVTTRTNAIKDNVAIDLAKLDLNSLKISDHIYQELATLTFRIRRGEAASESVELVVQQPAADAIKTVLERVAHACTPVH